jgi:hypothetical protein
MKLFITQIFIHPPISSSVLDQNVLSTLFCDISDFFPLMYETKFDTHKTSKINCEYAPALAQSV